MVPSQLAMSLGRGGYLDERVNSSGSCSYDMGPQLVGRYVCFHSVKTVVVACLQKGSVKLTYLLRCMSLYNAFYRFQMSAKHVPRLFNEVADALS